MVAHFEMDGPNGGVNSLRLLCCPEDVVCDQAHGAPDELCESCSIPLCLHCASLLHKSRSLKQRIPRQALANDNFIGFVSSFWESHRPRWIEMAAATPVWTSLMAFYVEGDKGHLMNNQARRVHATLSLSRPVSPSFGSPPECGVFNPRPPL